MKKRMNGLQWYKKVHNFLSSHKSYIVITQSDTQKLSLIDIINSSKGDGIRLKAENKKYGLYVSRGRRGNAAVVTEEMWLRSFVRRMVLRFPTIWILLSLTRQNSLTCHTGLKT